MVRLPDPIERAEMAAERWEDENVRDGKYKCGCGKWASLEDDAHPGGPDPYAPPICGECLEQDEKRTKESQPVVEPVEFDLDDLLGM